MKNVLSILALILFCYSIQAQENWNKAGINKMMEEYIGYTLKNDFQNSLDYLHPKLYEISPKEDLVESFQKMMEDPEMKTHFDDFEIQKISKIINYKGIRYAALDYTMTMRLQFLLKPEEGNSDVDDFLLSLYHAQFGEENVSLDRATRTYTINSNNQLFAIGDPSIGTWKMLENKKGMERFIEEIVPKKVRKKLKK